MPGAAAGSWPTRCTVRGARALTGSRFVVWLERTFGAALIFFGIRLALDRK